MSDYAAEADANFLRKAKRAARYNARRTRDRQHLESIERELDAVPGAYSYRGAQADRQEMLRRFDEALRKG